MQLATEQQNQQGGRAVNSSEVPRAPQEQSSATVVAAARARVARFEALGKSLAAIPDSLARVQTKVDPEHPTKTFVVIREMHHHKSLSPELRKEGLKSQAEVLDIVNKLAKELKPFPIVKDSVSPAVAENFNKRISHIHKHANTIATLENAIGTTDSKSSKALLETLKEQKADPQMINAVGFMMEYQNVREELFAEAKQDGVLNAALRRSVTFQATESPVLLRQVMELVKANPELMVDDPRMERLHEQRETFVVDNTVAQAEQDVVIGVFGGSHRFEPEVRAWNKENPDAQIRLIEVATKTFEENFPELVEKD